MGRPIMLNEWLLEGSSHSDFVRVIFYIWLGAGLLATNNCVAQGDELGLLTEFADYSEELKSHFCSCQEDDHTLPRSMCSSLCDLPMDEIECSNEGLGRRETRCMSQRETMTFICGFPDAIVCADEHEICMNETLPEDGVSKSFCICREEGAARPTVQNGSCVVEGIPALSVEVLVLVSCLLAILVILVIILICCICQKWRTRAKRRSRNSTLKLDKSDDLEYSYAYAHQARSPSKFQAEDPDLDADQVDHYYCHLKQEGRPSGLGKVKEDNGTDQKVPTQNKDDNEADTKHTYFVLRKMSTDEPAVICGEEDEKMSPSFDESDTVRHSYAKCTRKAERHIDSSGYEVAREQFHGDVKTTAFNQEEANMQPTVGAPPLSRDYGYEVANVTSKGDGGQERNAPGHSYVTLEPQTREHSENTDSEYEVAKIIENTDSGYEVAKIVEPNLQDEYDHLERKEPLKQREGAFPQNIVLQGGHNTKLKNINVQKFAHNYTWSR